MNAVNTSCISWAVETVCVLASIAAASIFCSVWDARVLELLPLWEVEMFFDEAAPRKVGEGRGGE